MMQRDKEGPLRFPFAPLPTGMEINEVPVSTQRLGAILGSCLKMVGEVSLDEFDPGVIARISAVAERSRMALIARGYSDLALQITLANSPLDRKLRVPN